MNAALYRNAATAVKSGRAEAVETTGIIRPLRIAEIGSATGERVGLHRLPSGIGKVGAGFHHDNYVAVAGDVEPKCRQAKLLKPDMGNAWGRCLKFISSHIHRSANYARIAIQIGAIGRKRIIPGIDARGIGLQPQITASQVHKDRRVGERAIAKRAIVRRIAELRYGATVVQLGIVAIIRVVSLVVIYDAVVQLSIVSTGTIPRIADNRAIILNSKTDP